MTEKGLPQRRQSVFVIGEGSVAGKLDEQIRQVRAGNGGVGGICGHFGADGGQETAEQIFVQFRVQILILGNQAVSDQRFLAGVGIIGTAADEHVQAAEEVADSGGFIRREEAFFLRLHQAGCKGGIDGIMIFAVFRHVGEGNFGQVFRMEGNFCNTTFPRNVDMGKYGGDDGSGNFRTEEEEW